MSDLCSAIHDDYREYERLCAMYGVKAKMFNEWEYEDLFVLQEKQIEKQEILESQPSITKAYFIECRTGCTCCSDDNHYRGPYRTREEAQKRIDYFKHPDSKYWPVASQYSRRGNYSICEYDVEFISDDRVIINDHVFSCFEFVELENGQGGNVDFFASYYDL